MVIINSSICLNEIQVVMVVFPINSERSAAGGGERSLENVDCV